MNIRVRKAKTIATDPRGYEYAMISIECLVPDAENPRIPPQDNALDAMLLPTIRTDRPGFQIISQPTTRAGRRNNSAHLKSAVGEPR